LCGVALSPMFVTPCRCVRVCRVRQVTPGDSVVPTQSRRWSSYQLQKGHSCLLGVCGMGRLWFSCFKAVFRCVQHSGCSVGGCWLSSLCVLSCYKGGLVGVQPQVCMSPLRGAKSVVGCVTTSFLGTQLYGGEGMQWHAHPHVLRGVAVAALPPVQCSQQTAGPGACCCLPVVCMLCVLPRACCGSCVRRVLQVVFAVACGAVHRAQQA
jgi:hypothetical protein